MPLPILCSTSINHATWDAPEDAIDDDAGPNHSSSVNAKITDAYDVAVKYSSAASPSHGAGH
jgi:hypothetical protein